MIERKSIKVVGNSVREFVDVDGHYATTKKCGDSAENVVVETERKPIEYITIFGYVLNV